MYLLLPVITIIHFAKIDIISLTLQVILHFLLFSFYFNVNFTLSFFN